MGRGLRHAMCRWAPELGHGDGVTRGEHWGTRGQSSRDPDTRAARSAGPQTAGLLLTKKNCERTGCRKELGTRELHELLSGASRSTQGHSLIQFLRASAQSQPADGSTAALHCCTQWQYVDGLIGLH
jgi:hypothetical protein